MKKMILNRFEFESFRVFPEGFIDSLYSSGQGDLAGLLENLPVEGEGAGAEIWDVDGEFVIAA